MTTAKVSHSAKAAAANLVDLILAFFPYAWQPSYKAEVDAMPLGIAIVVNVLGLACAGLALLAVVVFIKA